MSDKKIQTPEQVMEIMNTIEYGWMGIDNIFYPHTMTNIQKLYRLSSIEEILQNRAGVCFDQTELERFFFSQDYKTQSYAIINNDRIHSFLTLERDGQFIYFEHSFPQVKGIYYFDNKEKMLQYIIQEWKENHDISLNEKIQLIPYSPLIPNMTFQEIADYLLQLSPLKKENQI